MDQIKFYITINNKGNFILHYIGKEWKISETCQQKKVEILAIN